MGQKQRGDSERRAVLVRVAALVAFVVCLFLVIYGQTVTGWGHLGLQLLGLAGLLTMLGLYNRRFR